MATEAERLSFIRDAGWEDYGMDHVPADFSSRSFLRLTREGGHPSSVILMDAGADTHTDAFVHLSTLLRRLGIAAPTIYASDIPRGLVLMEDFGTENVGHLLDAGRDRTFFDAQAVSILARIHKDFRETMLGAFKTSFFNAALFSDQVTMFLDYYYPRLFRRTPTVRERAAFIEAWHQVLSPLDSLPRSLLLRDFMPDNMMLLPQPVMRDTVGLIDFQDAGIGCIAYDLASWCEEVRRDGGLSRMEDVVQSYYALNNAVSYETLLTATQIYAAQRHARILGILVKLDRLDHIPRVWRTLQTLLKAPALAPVRHWFLSCPPPQ
jgi:aminoglycoside/choline kinase family phosphotransferase